MKQITNGTVAALAATLALTACHDDSFVPGLDNDTGDTAEGVYGGTLTNDPSGATDFEAIVLEDGSFWALYGQAGASSFDVQGFARGSGASVEGSFTSQEATDFGFIPPTAAELEATYDTSTATIDGSFTTVAGTTDFSGGPIPNSDYDYLSAPDPQMLVGSWTVEDLDSILYTVDVAANGTFDFAEQGGGCTGSGTMTPRASGKNVFDVSLDFDNVVDCADPGGSADGIALVYTITGMGTDQLVVAINDGDTFGTALFGTRPSP